MKNNIYDLIIVGAGPSGSSAAYRASKIGLKTLLIEKDTFPRYKPCGGAVSKLALSYLDFPIPDNIIQNEIFGARIHYNGKYVEKYKDNLLSVLVLRSEFDNYLMEKAAEAGAEIRLKEKVTDFTESSECVTVNTNLQIYKTKYLIIAEGFHGKLKRKIRKRDSRKQFGICIVTEVPESERNINSYIKNAIDIHFGVARLGYGWIFPLRNHYSVGIGGIADNFKKPADLMNKFIKQNNLEKPVRENNIRYKAHMIPAGGIKRVLNSQRVLLSGDSAGFVDSFTGEGIAYAIRSGQIAAELIAEAINNNTPSAVKNYEKKIMAEFGCNLKYSLIVSKIMHRIPALFFKIFTSSDDILDKYLDVTSMKISYKQFFTWLLPRTPLFLLKSFIK